MLNKFRVTIIETTVKECDVYLTAKEEQQAEKLARTIYESFIDEEDWQVSEAGGIDFVVEKGGEIQFSVNRKVSDT